MEWNELKNIIKLGENSEVQFKERFSSADALAAEITAFANMKGGIILVGITDAGEVRGLTKNEVGLLNQMISNVCSQKIVPSLSVTTEHLNFEGRIVVIIHVPVGPNKFYMANGMDVWVKVAADKRRASREELRRLLQESCNLFADIQPIEGTSINDLDKYLLEEFLEKRTGERIDMLSVDFKKVLENMKILKEDTCTLAGLLLFGGPTFTFFSNYQISAVSWYGNELGSMEYRDSEDIKGNVTILFREGIAFLKRQLKKVQKGQHVNSLGILEIPEIALEEALINAIVHRNFFVQSHIRLFVFDNRVEIISPGSLPNTLTIESIKTGIHLARNPVILSHIKDIKGIPYRGAGMGVARIIKSCRDNNSDVEFFNEVDKEQFRVVFMRNATS